MSNEAIPYLVDLSSIRGGTGKDKKEVLKPMTSKEKIEMEKYKEELYRTHESIFNKLNNALKDICIYEANQNTGTETLNKLKTLKFHIENCIVEFTKDEFE